jgi:hypothetical protein
VIPDLVANLGHDRLEPAMRVSFLQIFDDRPASDGNRQEDGKGQSRYYPAGVRVMERKIMRAGFNLRLCSEWWGNRKAMEHSHRLIAASAYTNAMKVLLLGRGGFLT